MTQSYEMHREHQLENIDTSYTVQIAVHQKKISGLSSKMTKLKEDKKQLRKFMDARVKDMQRQHIVSFFSNLPCTLPKRGTFKRLNGLLE